MATPTELLSEARCFNCIPPGMQGPVLIYLLMQNAGLDMTPAELMEAAKCYNCIPPGMQLAVQTYLLDNGGGGGGGSAVGANYHIVGSGTPATDVPPAGYNQAYNDDGNEWFLTSIGWEQRM